MDVKATLTVLIALAMVSVVGPNTEAQDKPDPLPVDQAAALGRISADSMRGHLSFLASDLLEGRDSPSRGLDLAAEYIAAQFRRAGLKPVGDDGYFQTATWRVAMADASAFVMEIQADGETYRIDPSRVSLPGRRQFEVEKKDAFKIDFQAPERVAALQREQVEGKVVLVEMPDAQSAPQARRQEILGAVNAFLGQVRMLRPALIVNINRDPEAATGLGNGNLIDPESPGIAFPRMGAGGPASITIHDARLAKQFDALPVGEVPVRVTLRLPAPVSRPVKLRNVIGLLPGSDPALGETYVMVTAHYDHVGIGAPIDGDRIYNGANDDGSGTVSVIELASALATLKDKERPKRSLVFLTFFGEEHGLLGSRYYARHPVFPIEKTVADLNLEQVGRTDSSEGPQVGTASLTGIDFSDVGSIVQAAGEAEGVRVYKHPRNSDAYFNASDNRSLAELGVPAHSVSVAYAYPDYHGPHDHWDKVDYVNMARVDRVIGRAMLMIANSAEAPRWNEANPRAARYLDAWKRLQGRADGKAERKLDHGRLDRDVKEALAGDLLIRASLWVGGRDGAGWYTRQAGIAFPTASAIKTAILIELFGKATGALDQPPPGLDRILRDDHPAIAHFEVAARDEIRRQLSGASVRKIGGVMMGSIPAPNLVYNAAANVAIALLGGPEALTRAIQARDPAFAPIQVRRYMLTDRSAHGDNEATAEALAAVLQRLAAKSVPRLDSTTIDAVRHAVLSKDEGAVGRHFRKEGDLASDPITHVESGWYESPEGEPLVYVVMLALQEPPDRSREGDHKQVVTSTHWLTDRLLKAALASQPPR